MAKRSAPPSVQSGIPRLGECPRGWRTVTFGEVLKEVSRPATVQPQTEYQLVVAKRSRGGIAPRERLVGTKILTKTQFYIEPGDFLISNRQIVHGACGIVPQSLSGAIVSNEYTVLHPTEELDLTYLWYLAHTVYFQQTCFHSSVGVDVEKMIFRLPHWLKRKIHLPPVSEQVRIAEILSTWDRAIYLLDALHDRNDSVLADALKSLFSRNVHSWKLSTLGKVAEISGGNAFPPRAQGVRHGDHPFIKVSDMNAEGNERYILRAANYVSASDLSELRARLFPKGTLVFPKVGAALQTNKRRLLSAATVLDNNLMGAVPKEVDPDFLYFWSLTLDLSRFCQTGALPSVNQSTVSEIPIPIPPRSVQEATASSLNVLYRHQVLLSRLRKLYEAQKFALLRALFSGQLRAKS